MSKASQCPSTVGEKPERKAKRALPRSAATGKQYWRGLEELADTPEFRERLEREFPAFASELLGESRRHFLKVMGASLALAGVGTVAGCRRPEHRILPYTETPEDVIPGKPLFYATAMPLPGGGAEGILVETHEGRPTKIEGNPLHPVNQGKSSLRSQASILDLYDPERLTGPSRRDGDERVASSWAEYLEIAGAHFRSYDATGGEGLAFLVEKQSSPSRDAMRDRIRSKWPNAKWLPYEPIDDEQGIEASRLAFGSPHREVFSLGRAKVILAVERELLGNDGHEGTLPDSRGYASGRRVLEANAEMSRVYAIESNMTMTGGAADHRLRVNTSEVGPVFAALARAVLSKMGVGAGLSSLRNALSSFESLPGDLGVGADWIDAVADDLVEAGGESLVAVGPSQPSNVRALGHAINAALEAVGTTVRYIPMSEDEATSSLESIRALSRDIEGGTIKTLVVLGANPVYDAPADLGFAEKYRSVQTTIHLGLREDETAHASTWRLNRAHYLETWSDVRAADGTMSVVQPMIRPLAYETQGGEPGRGDLEVLALALGESTTDPYEIVQRTWRQGPLSGAGDFRRGWRRTLHDGLLAGSTQRGSSPRPDMGAISSAVSRIAPPSTGLEAVFRACPKVHDGRFANNGWLQELAHPISKMTWDNPILISPAKAAELNLRDGQMVRLGVNGRTLEAPVFRLPGLGDRTVIIELGYGRTKCGPVANGTGFDTYAVRTVNAMRHATGIELEKIGGRVDLACIQTHWSMEGRPIIQEADLGAWNRHHEAEKVKDAYGREKTLRFGERLGLLSHTPANIDVYRGVITDQSLAFRDSPDRPRPQWGMAIDLSTCSGCSACTIACQAENNIPVVGKPEVLKGREMSWIRVDRYFGSPDSVDTGDFTGDFGSSGPYTGGRLEGDVDMMVQPVACVHCENAPCETVCPVNATIHDEEGLNVMSYNRCIGTRYCSNNCPYKVRRFNYFDYATKKPHGDYVGKELLGGIVTNQNWIPPRLRERIEAGKGELRIMQYNPNVTVRERGVMEKCTYCIQRIHEARLESKLQDFDHIPDGMFQTACQQACPTESIFFGDIDDPNSEVRRVRDNGRSYGLLGYLNTKPRTNHLVRLRNPNPRLREPVVDPFHHAHGNGHGDGGDNGHGGGQSDEGHVMSLPVLNSSSRRAVASVARTIVGGGA